MTYSVGYQGVEKICRDSALYSCGLGRGAMNNTCVQVESICHNSVINGRPIFEITTNFGIKNASDLYYGSGGFYNI